MNLVDEQNITPLQVRDHCGQITRAFQRRTTCCLEVGSHLDGQDPGQRGLAKTGRSGEQDMVDRFATLSGRLNENG